MYCNVLAFLTLDRVALLRLSKYAHNATALRYQLTNHVSTVVRYYRDQMYSWDVVNEAVSDNPQKENYLKHNIWYPTGECFTRVMHTGTVTPSPNLAVYFLCFFFAHPTCADSNPEEGADA